MKTDLDTFIAAGRLAAAVGFRWYMGDWPAFDPKLGHAADTASDLCHELAHFLTAPKWLRNKPHFGLGHPVSSPRLVSCDHASRLEHEASILGIVLAYKCGLSLEESISTADEHSWFEYLMEETPDVVIARLKNKKLWSDEAAEMWRKIIS